MKLKKFCTAKDNINKKKRQTSEWEKIFANEYINKIDKSLAILHRKEKRENIKFNIRK